MQQVLPSVAIVPSIPTTGWWHVASSARGRQSLTSLEAAKAELARREEERPRILSIEERDRLATLGPDLAAVWTAATTTPRDRKELLGTLIEEVIVKVERDQATSRCAGRAVH